MLYDKLKNFIHEFGKKPLFFRVAIVSIVLIFLLWCGWSYTRPNNFPIKNVKIISSYEHVDREVLQSKVNLYVRNGFFYLNVINMKQQLLALPWVYAVWIQREWPDSVIINVIEQQAVLQWGDTGLINPKGELFTPPVATFPKGLPVIWGPENKEYEFFCLYREMQQLLAPLNLTVRKLIFNLQHYWEVVLNNQTVVYLKEQDPIGQLKLLINLYEKLMVGHKGAPKSIDLRYNNAGLAVKWE